MTRWAANAVVMFVLVQFAVWAFLAGTWLARRTTSGRPDVDNDAADDSP